MRLFVDMDGVIAKFTPTPKLETLYEKGYFSSLEPLINVVSAIKEISYFKKPEVFILSAFLSDSNYALSEKNIWLDTYLPEIPVANRLFLPCGQSKLEWLDSKGFTITKKDFLLDDYSLNLHEWTKMGTGIKLLNGINNTKGTWKGMKVFYKSLDLKNDIMDCLANKSIQPVFRFNKTENSIVISNNKAEIER